MKKVYLEKLRKNFQNFFSHFFFHFFLFVWKEVFLKFCLNGPRSFLRFDQNLSFRQYLVKLKGFWDFGKSLFSSDFFWWPKRYLFLQFDQNIFTQFSPKFHRECVLPFWIEVQKFWKYFYKNRNCSMIEKPLEFWWWKSFLESLSLLLLFFGFSSNSGPEKKLFLFEN